MNKIISKKKFTKEEKSILLNHLIKVCHKLRWIETDPDCICFILDPFMDFPFSYYKIIIQMYYEIRSQISPTTSDKQIRDTLYYCIYDHSPMQKTIKLLLKEGAHYRTQSIRYRKKV